MWIWRLRDPRMVAVAVAIIVIVAAVAVLDLEREITYSYEPLFTVPWGTAPGEAGLADGADGEFYGPRSFYVGDGRIILADTFNARIQVFDYSGALLAVHDLKDLPPSAGVSVSGTGSGGAASVGSAGSAGSAGSSASTGSAESAGAAATSGTAGAAATSGTAGGHPLAAFASPTEGVLHLGPPAPAGEGGMPAPGAAYSLGAGHPWINDLVVDGRGHIFAADSAGLRIIQLNEGGQYAAVVDLPPLSGSPGGSGGSAGRGGPGGAAAGAGDATAWLLDQLEISRQGALYLAHTYLSDEIYGRRLVSLFPGQERFETLASASMGEGRDLTFETGLPLPLPANSFVLAPRGYLTVEARGADPFSRIIRTYREGGIQTDDWLVRHERPIANARLLGADMPGTAWITINGGRPDGIITAAAPAGEDGPPVFRPGWQGGFHANVFARRDEAGNIFAAVPGPRGWSLEMWRAHSRRSLKFAGRR